MTSTVARLNIYHAECAGGADQNKKGKEDKPERGSGDWTAAQSCQANALRTRLGILLLLDRLAAVDDSHALVGAW